MSVNRVSRLYTVDVGNNDFIFLCNFGGRIIDVFEVEMRKMEGRGEGGGGRSQEDTKSPVWECSLLQPAPSWLTRSMVYSPTPVPRRSGFESRKPGFFLGFLWATAEVASSSEIIFLVEM